MWMKGVGSEKLERHACVVEFGNEFVCLSYYYYHSKRNLDCLHWMRPDVHVVDTIRDVCGKEEQRSLPWGWVWAKEVDDHSQT